MKNKLDKSTMSNGGTVSHHSREDVEVRVPPHKATGNLPSEKLPGAAKASPSFKPIEPKIPTDEKRVIAESSKAVPQDKPAEKLPIPVKTVENKPTELDEKLND